jgi:predicted NBD/HSP70 family sugar kinase
MPRQPETASTELNRNMNRDLLLKLLRLHQPVARVDLARLSGLRNSTVSTIVDQLLKEGWICEGLSKETARGRRPTMLSLNDGIALLVADVHPGFAHFGIVDLSGVLLKRKTLPLPSKVTESFTAIADALNTLRRSMPDKRFVGAGLCVPGRVDPATRRIVMSPNLRWTGLDLQTSISRRLKLPVEVENDANASLLSELWFAGLSDSENTVLISISDGVGAAILAEGHLFRGRLGLAGEFGHVIYDPSGPVCGCGRTGCWEMFASSRGALRFYRENTSAPRQESYSSLCERAASGDKHSLAAIEEQARAIGHGLRMVLASLAPGLILLSGEVSRIWPIAGDIIRRECAHGVLGGTVPRLRLASFGEDAQLLGAAAVVLQRHYSYYRAQGFVSRSPS